ncbi:DUF3168 domain-containing protein [Terriglobus roseus]|uniref:DUF3168 domain-containing protein n=1 Tax=Terriglobus roseus TaxID=392734 RepID=A0A1H4J3B0_9BACT|nr:DUF3168 domain-containing protein [Terriglobus roseus]SEB40701.1 Protein of unknown function [Terriglobus roseus]
MLEEGLFQLLTSDSDVASCISTRYFPLMLPDDAALPAVTYQRVSTVTSPTLNGFTDLVQVRLQIDTWATTYADARRAAQAIQNAIEGFLGTLPDGTAVAAATLLSQMDTYESVARYYRVTTDYRIIASR